jgi:LPS-assembly protein
MRVALLFLSITAAGGIHQHLAAQQVTDQTPPAPAQPATQELPDLSEVPRAVPFVPRPRAESVEVAESVYQSVHRNLYTLREDVEITYQGRTLRADEVTYDKATGEITATGHVRVSGGRNQEQMSASRGTYNLRSGVGKLFDVTGSVGMKGPTLDESGSAGQFLFAGRVVVKRGPEEYDVYDGWVTSCQLPRPDWQLTAGHLWIADGEARAKASVFHLLGMPVLFLPYVTHPTDESRRQSGLLIPVISQSNTKGIITGEQVYLALGRSADATVGFDYYSLRGFAEMGTFRFRGPGEDFLNAHFSALQDRGIPQTTGGVTQIVDQGGQDVTASFRRDLTARMRAVGDAEYLSSYVYREAFNDNFNQAVSSDITSTVFLTHQANGIDIDGRFDRYQGLKRVPYINAQGQNVAGQDVRIFHAPSIDATALDHHVGTTPLLWNVTASMAGLKRVQPNFQTSGVVPRFDIRPELALPLSGEGWHLLASAALRETHYGSSRAVPYSATAAPVELHQSIDRTSVTMQVDVRPPVVERTFEVPKKWQHLLGTEVRHTVEPEIEYRKTSGVDNFLQVLRFDDIDLDSNTNQLEYGVTQHLYFKRPAPAVKLPEGCKAEVLPGAESVENPTPLESADDVMSPTADSSTDANGIPSVSANAPDSPVRAHGRRNDPCARPRAAVQKEWFSWRDPTFGNAIINGRRNVFDATLSFSGIAFLTEPRNISPMISRMRLRTSSHTDLEWDFDFDTGAKRFTSSNVFADAHEGPWFGGFSYARLNAPGRFYTESIDTNNTGSLTPSLISDFSQMRLLGGYGSPTKPGISVAANAGLDLGNASLQYASLQTSYNWNCCGLSVEYRKYELGTVRNEGQYRFSFTLINIGSAGNLRRQERLF